MAQLVRAPPCHGGGREFESLLGRYGIIAQLGEHLPYKQRVIGSSPIGPIKLNNMDGFPSGQRGQTVNLLQIASVVRIHLHPLGESLDNRISRGGAFWKLVGLITRRS